MSIKSFGRLVKLDKGWSHAHAPRPATIRFLQKDLAFSFIVFMSSSSSWPIRSIYSLLFLGRNVGLLRLPFTTTFSLQNNRRVQSFQYFMLAPWPVLFLGFGPVWFCSALVNSDILTIYYGIKQSQFTKPTPEPPR